MNVVSSQIGKRCAPLPCIARPGRFCTKVSAVGCEGWKEQEAIRLHNCPDQTTGITQPGFLIPIWLWTGKVAQVANGCNRHLTNIHSHAYVPPPRALKPRVVLQTPFGLLRTHDGTGTAQCLLQAH